MNGITDQPEQRETRLAIPITYCVPISTFLPLLGLIAE